MKRIIFAFLVGGILGAGAGFIIGIFVYPYIFLADIVAREQAPETASLKRIAQGTFIHANPSDPLHYGKGTVTVYESLVRLGEDFEVGPGPKFHVYLVPLDEVTPSTDVAQSMYVDLGRLRAFKGSQNFPIPAGLDLSAFKHVVIWCEHFSVLISPAKLTPKS
jgi:hypothetical protein